MEPENELADLGVVGAEFLPAGRSGLRIRGWLIESLHRPILSSSGVQRWENEIGTSHLPEMVFGESSLVLIHLSSGVKIHFNALDALKGWKHEALPPVEVPAAAKWKFRSKPSQQVILDYDYTFTTPYCGSETFNPDEVKTSVIPDDISKLPHRIEETSQTGSCNLCWEDCKEQIDLVALASREPILFYDEVILYEDELADNGVSLLTVKVRVMPSSWFLLLRFWLRVDGVLMRLRDTRIYCCFSTDGNPDPVILREICWRESTFQELTAKGFPSDAAAYSDPNLIGQRLSIVMQKTQKLKGLR